MLTVVPSRRAGSRLADLSLAGPAGPGPRSRAVWTHEIVTLRDLVDAALADHPAPRPRLSEAARSFLVAETVAGLEPGVRRLFGPGADGAGAAGAVGPALALLRGAGLSALDVAAATGGSRRLRALAAALDAWERRLAELDAWDEADALRAAVERVRSGAWPAGPLDRLEVRGLYDTTRLQGELLLALARRAAVTRVHVPFEPHDPDATAYAYPYVHLWESMEDPGLDVELRFADPAGPVGMEEAGPEIRFRAAADPADEARLVATEVRRWIDGGCAPEEIGIVVPTAPGRPGALTRELDRRGVPHHARRGAPLAETPAFAARLLPFRLLEEGWPRTGIRAWIASPLAGGLDAGRLLPLVAGGPSAGGGLGAWRRAFGGEPAARPLIEALTGLDTLGRAEAPPADFWPTWEGILARTGIAPDGAWADALDEVRAGLESIGRWDGPPAGWRAHRRRLLDAIGRRRAGIGRPGRGVEILTPLDARGIAFRRQAVLGLSRGALVGSDPAAAVLGDAERGILNEALGGRWFRTRFEDASEGALLLAERLRLTAEEALLTWPAEDESGTPTLPALELERERGRRGASPLEPPLPSVSPAWRRGVGPDRVAALQALERDRTFFFGRDPGERAATAGPFDGAFRADRAAALLAEVDGGGLSRWSAGALESWRLCPHLFFQRSVLGLRAPEERPLEPEATTVGTLAHEALRILFEEGDALPPDRERIDDAVGRAAAGIGETKSGDPGIFAVTRERVAATLHRYLVEIDGRPDRGFRPVAFELGFGMDDGGLEAIPVPTAVGRIALRGRLDRLDRHPGTGRLHVLDYKYARKRKDHADAVDPAVCGVDRFQLYAYFLAALEWAAARGLSTPPTVTGAIHCVREPRVLGDLVAPPAADIRAAIAAAVEAAARGPFDPTPRDPRKCAWCDFRRTCRIATVPGGDGPAAPPEDEE